MKVISEAEHFKVRLSVKCANSVLDNPNFYERISGKPYFDIATAKPSEISKLIQDTDMVFRVATFKPKGFYQRIKYHGTLALTEKRYPGRLFVNENKLDGSAERIAASIIHESIRALDDISTLSFGHGDNVPHDKSNTAPYWIANLAYRILMHELDHSPLDFEDITVVRVTV